MADVISETGGIGFTVQAVADRAGLTHRTVYNHFPTREALCDAFAQYVDGLLESTGVRMAANPLLPGELPTTVASLFKALGRRDRHARAYVMLMIANRRPTKAWSDRTRALERKITRKVSGRAPLAPRQVTAAVRLFMSSVGWHLLTEQCGLSTDEAAVTSAWAIQTLVEAATGQRASASIPSSTPSQRGSHATRRR